MNLAQSFWQHLGKDSGRVILERLEADGHVTWRQTRGALQEEASQWMAALRAAGVGPGDRVTLSLGKSSGLVTAHLAVLGVGAGVVPLNPSLTARETEAVLEKAEAKLAITHAETVARSPQITSTVHGPWWIVGQEEEPPFDTESIHEVLSAHRPGPEPVDRSDNDLALLLFTSGTTGTPKGAGLTHRNLRSNLQALLVDTWEMHEHDRLLHALPPHHLHGLGLGLYGTLYVGNSAVLLDRFDPAVALRAFGSQHITLFMGVPTMYHRMLEVEGHFDLSSVRLLTCGSAPLSVETFRRFQERFGFSLVERYGLTETAINTSNPINGGQRPGSVGCAVLTCLVDIGAILKQPPRLLLVSGSARVTSGLFLRMGICRFLAVSKNSSLLAART